MPISRCCGGVYESRSDLDDCQQVKRKNCPNNVTCVAVEYTCKKKYGRGFLLRGSPTSQGHHIQRKYTFFSHTGFHPLGDSKTY
jgi:hypothetical protein